MTYKVFFFLFPQDPNPAVTFAVESLYGKVSLQAIPIHLIQTNIHYLHLAFYDIQPLKNL